MSTEYVRRVTIVAPESEMADANQLALALGESASDDRTFVRATFKDANGNRYCQTSTVTTANFETKAASSLQAPAHAPGVDLAAAARAQSLVYIYGVHGTEGAAPGRIWVFVEPAPGDEEAALALAGMQRLPVAIQILLYINLNKD